jgi:hypothetical protein
MITSHDADYATSPHSLAASLSVAALRPNEPLLLAAFDAADDDIGGVDEVRDMCVCVVWLLTRSYQIEIADAKLPVADIATLARARRRCVHIARVRAGVRSSGAKRARVHVCDMRAQRTSNASGITARYVHGQARSHAGWFR